MVPDRLRRFHGADVSQRLGPVRLLRVAHPSGARRRQHRERRRRRRPGGRGRHHSMRSRGHHSMRSRGHHSMRRHSHSMRRRSSSRLIPRHELFAGFQQGEVSSRARVEHARRAGGFEESGESRRGVERVQTGGVRERDAGLRRDGDDDRARAIGRHGGATVGLELLRGLRLEEHRLGRRDAPAAREAVAQSHLDRAGAATGAVGRGREEERGGSVEAGDATPRLWRRTSPPWVRRGWNVGCAPTVRRGWRTAVGTLVHDGGANRDARSGVADDARTGSMRNRAGRGRTSGTSRSFAPRSSLSPASRMGGEGRRRGQIRAGRGARDEMKKAGRLGGRRTHPDAPLRATTQACDGAMKSSRSPSFTAPENPAIAWTRPRRRVCAARRECSSSYQYHVDHQPRRRSRANHFRHNFADGSLARADARRVASRRYRDDGEDAIARRMYSYLRST